MSPFSVGPQTSPFDGEHGRKRQIGGIAGGGTRDLCRIPTVEESELQQF
jgi:hypothetical protein